MSSTPHDAHQPGSWDRPEDVPASPVLDPHDAPGAEETPVWSPLEDRSDDGESAGSALEPRAQDAPRSAGEEAWSSRTDRTAASESTGTHETADASESLSAGESAELADPLHESELTEASQAPVGEEPVAAPGSSAYSYPGADAASTGHPSSGYPTDEPAGYAAPSGENMTGQAPPSSAGAGSAAGAPYAAPYGQMSAGPAGGGYAQAAGPASAPYGQSSAPDGAAYGQSAAPAGAAYGQPAGAPAAGYGQPLGAPAAGYGQPADAAAAPGGTSRIVAGLLGILLGGFGVHRFVMGYTTIGIIQILVTVVTCGAGSLWGLIEGILILVGAEGFTRDAQGRPLTD